MAAPIFVQTRHTMPLRIPDGTTAKGRVLGGIFGLNGENAGALLDASNTNTIEFRGDFVALKTP